MAKETRDRLIVNHWSTIIESQATKITSSQILDSLIETEEKIKQLSRINLKVEFFYRGESEDYGNTCLTPSVLRNNDEKTEYFDALTHFPQEFAGLSNLSKLAKMQHYTYPTRLLDLTTNPLVALWFACSDYSRYGGTGDIKDKNGYFYIIAVHEDSILTHDSDRALLLSCLAKLDDFNEKPALTNFLDILAREWGGIENVVITNELVNSYRYNETMLESIRVFEKFIGEAGRERAALANYRTRATDLLSTFIVRPQIENERLKKQEGIFAIFGIQSSLYNNSECYKIYRFQIPKTSKKRIILELDKLGINEATLFGDMESRANYNRFNKRMNA